MEAVAVAVVTAIPATVAAVASWRAAKYTRGNGRGNVAEMADEILCWIERHEQRHRLHDYTHEGDGR